MRQGRSARMRTSARPTCPAPKSTMANSSARTGSSSTVRAALPSPSGNRRGPSPLISICRASAVTCASAPPPIKPKARCDVTTSLPAPAMSLVVLTMTPSTPSRRNLTSGSSHGAASATGSKSRLTSPPQHWPRLAPSGKRRSAFAPPIRRSRAIAMALCSRWPPPIVPWTAAAVTIIFVPASRGAEPRVDATVTTTAGCPQSRRRTSVSIQWVIRRLPRHLRACSRRRLQNGLGFDAGLGATRGELLDREQDCLGGRRSIETGRQRMVRSACGGIADRVERRDSEHQRWLADRLRAKNEILGVAAGFVDPCIELRRYVACHRNLVRGRRVRHQLALVVPPQLFRREPTRPLDEATLDLAHVDRRVQRLPNVVQNVDAQQPVFAGQRVHDYFGYRGAVAIIIERSAAPGFAVIADLGCAVKAGGRQRDAREVGELDELVERQ